MKEVGGGGVGCGGGEGQKGEAGACNNHIGNDTPGRKKGKWRDTSI